MDLDINSLWEQRENSVIGLQKTPSDTKEAQRFNRKEIVMQMKLKNIALKYNNKSVFQKNVNNELKNYTLVSISFKDRNVNLKTERQKVLRDELIYTEAQE